MSVGRKPEDVVVITGTGGMGVAIARRLGSGRYIVLGDYARSSTPQVSRRCRRRRSALLP
jgi:NAD(P)-dependent dehydrogenase (short-subunit alcohol dehydrogenase family)